MERPPDDHEGGWKTFATDLESKLADTSARLDAVVAKMAAIEQKLLGRKSEKLPPISDEVRKKRPVDPAKVRATRRKNAELRATKVVTEQVKHAVPETERRCPKCDGTKLRPVGEGKISSVIDYVPGYFRRRERFQRSEREAARAPGGRLRLPPHIRCPRGSRGRIARRPPRGQSHARDRRCG